MDFTSEPASGSVTPTAVMSSPDDLRQVLRDLRLRARVHQVRRGHVGVHQHGDREAAEGGAAELLGQQRGSARIHCAAAEFLAVAQAEKAKLAHLAQHFARHEALLLPLVTVGNDLLLDEAADALPQQAMGVVHRSIMTDAKGLAGALGVAHLFAVVLQHVGLAQDAVGRNCR